MSELKITSISDLKKYAEGEIVELPPFANNQPFVARMRRPSLLKLIEAGKIPNGLVTFANRLFYNSTVTKESDFENENLLPQMHGVLAPVAKASMLEPTYDDVVNAGLEFTDDQLMFIFSYSQKGVDALKPFRGK